MATHLTLSSSVFLSPLKPISLFTKSPPLLHLKRPFLITYSVQQSIVSPPSIALQTFWQWLSDQGAVSAKSPAKPGIVPEGLGLIAERDISKNEVVLEIPKKLWINPDAVAASDIGSVCSGLKPWISVALFLIREKLKEDSTWRPYLDILPESTNSTIYWLEEELAELQGSQLFRTTSGVKEYLQREFLKVEEDILIPHKELFPSPITLDDFFWAFGILRSRAFARLRGQNLVLIPLADLINHSPDITTEDYAYEIKGGGLFSGDLRFSLRSPISVKAGEQVPNLLIDDWMPCAKTSLPFPYLIAYYPVNMAQIIMTELDSGSKQVLIQYDLNKTNAELALDHGFIETNSVRNTYTLTLQISESDPFFDDKLDVAETNGLGQTADFDIVMGNPLPPAMLPYLRLVALGGTDAFLLESLFRNTIWGHLELPVSRANEELICRVVRDACKSALSGYHTTIEEDEKLEEEAELNPRLKIAVGIRAGEKKVLHQIDEIFKQRESELDVLEYYQERRLKELGLVGEQGDIIFWESK